MKKIILAVLLTILAVSTFADSSNLYKNKNPTEVLSVSYTIFFNNHRFDEVTVYLSTFPKERESSRKVYSVVALLAKNLSGDGWFRTPENYQQYFIRDKIDIDVIQKNEGIKVVINRDGIMIGKVFDFNQEPEYIVFEILCKLFGSEA